MMQPMDSGADIEVLAPSGERIAVVEVKRAPHIDRVGAAQWRRNMTVHGLVPPAAYFLLVTGEQIYLWKQSADEVPDVRQPDKVGSTEAAIGPFLTAAGLTATNISEQALELATAAWLGELARDPEAQEPRWLASTGLFEALNGANVRIRTAA